MAAIITAIIAATLAYTLRSGDYLVLRNGDTNAEYARFRVKEGDEFSVTFIHSVNKYPLTDVYEIRDHKIYVIRTIYNNFGAGVQTEIEAGQTLTYDENGEMVGNAVSLIYCGYGLRPHTHTSRKRNQFEGSLRTQQQSRVLL